MHTEPDIAEAQSSHSISEQMLAAARGARPYLGRRRERITRYIQSQLSSEGGFRDRAGAPDLYYTVFGIDALLALEAALPELQLAGYLNSYGDGSALDFMHLTCLARCWARLPEASAPLAIQEQVLARIETFRTPDGGYHTTADAKSGSVTGIYLALAAQQDMARMIQDAAHIEQSLEAIRTPDCCYANERGLACGTTLATAGAIILRACLGFCPDASAEEWLWKQTSPTGGFLASPVTPMPDLLSTATAIYAARVLGHSMEAYLEDCVIFTESLQSDENGGYAGHWLDDLPDCEYTFYALLVLGCLMGESGIDSSEFMD